ncbi:putative enzyme related to lactoylglutathione lyase [Caulobacter ginsengisoli]|uniref:Enzyme related to lactoylglutathione lyase n=1 Tax=Caulobacter ginsengisoli TaxID=400775 RepID=A0ABU0IKZ3_9CAUL|nr:VOC family protein [Caulobacter ginsengisoli]MDQ0462678.1 putative enzyme related to lactoylglutathione lyase [Caulobacter ginsengisoli]
MADTFHWYELLTPDPAAAAKFYSAVVGWEVEAMGPYTLLKTAKGGVAGIATQPPEVAATGLGPGWVGYIGVQDVNAAALMAHEAGGKILIEPTDVMGILTSSWVTDPQGTVYVVFKGNSPNAPPTGGPEEPGYFGWRELMAVDGASALDFYCAQYGWTQAETHDMGPMGVYRIFNVDGVQTGGVMTKPAEMPHSVWNFYIQVDAIGAAVERVKAGGGQVIMDPMQVPGGLWVVQCTDPQGAVCSLISPNP